MNELVILSAAKDLFFAQLATFLENCR